MEKKEKIETLKPSELLLNDINLIVVSCDKNGNITYVSPATERIIGHKANILMGKQWWESTFLSKEEGQHSKEKVCNIISGKAEVSEKPYDRALLCEDGSHKWIEWRDSIGVDNTFISVGVDITYWKEKEEIKILAESILKNIDLMLLVSDEKGGVIYASPSVENMIGYSVEEIMGDNWWKVTYEDQEEAQRIKNAIYKFIFFNEKNYIDIAKRRIRTKNGDYKWVEWQISKGVNGTYISIGTDITNKIDTELELKNAKETAEKSLKVKNEFLANMSHEIRTPLNSIIGFTDLLLETDLTEGQTDHLKTIQNSGDILLSLINNVLDLTKLETSNFEIEEIQFNLHNRMQEVVKLMKLKADKKKIALDLIIAPDTPTYVISDPTRLGQILLNLIGNAVKFTNDGSVIVSVKQLSETPETSEVYFEIHDTGIGIVSTKINTVFGTFTQAKSDTSRIYGGTGLGLSIVKKLVQLLNGSIIVKSKFGVGSVFQMTLPFRKGLIDESTTEIESEVSWDDSLDLNILLVEDNKTNQLLAKTRLERWNCNVDIGNNGIEGVKKAQNNMYDVILMDIQMPVMDGYEATRIIKNDLTKEISNIPIIAMTAYTSKAEVKRALDVGMVDCVFKPFKPVELYKTLKKYGDISKNLQLKGTTDSKSTDEDDKVEKLVDFTFLIEETQNESSILILLIELFIRDLEEFFETIDKEFEVKNWKGLFEATHKVKPSISMFGITKMEPIIHSLVNKFRNEKQLEDVEELIESLIEIFGHVKKELLVELESLRDE